MENRSIYFEQWVLNSTCNTHREFWAPVSKQVKKCPALLRGIDCLHN